MTPKVKQQQRPTKSVACFSKRNFYTVQPEPCTAEPIVVDDFFSLCSGVRQWPHEVWSQLERLVPSEDMAYGGCCSWEVLCSGWVQLPHVQALPNGGVLEDSTIAEAPGNMLHRLA